MPVSGQARIAIGIASAALLLSWLVYVPGLPESSVLSPPASVPANLARHPLYAQYQFGNDASVIDIGTQPLDLPGVITEVMKRDPLLHSILAEQGLEARFHPFLKGADVNFFLARGDLEAGILGDMPALVACAKFRVLVASLIDQHLASLVAREQLMLSELKGKRIGFPYGSNAHYGLLVALEAAGLGADDIHMIPMNVNQMIAALHDGSIDVFAAWEPIPAIALRAYPEMTRITRMLVRAYLTFARPFAENMPELTRVIVASQIRAMWWIKASEANLRLASEWTLAAGQEIGGDNSGLSVTAMAKIVDEGLLGLSPSVFISPQGLVENADLFKEYRFLLSAGEISRQTSWDDISGCFDSELVPDILAQAEHYNLRSNGYLADFANAE